MAGPGGPFSDLVLIDSNLWPYGWNNPVGDVARAAGVVRDFGQECTALLTVGPELVGQFSIFIFSLALDALVKNTPLQESNRIPSSLVTATKTFLTSASAPSTSSCPDPMKTPVSCIQP
jgi:hypothetical protein